MAQWLSWTQTKKSTSLVRSKYSMPSTSRNFFVEVEEEAPVAALVCRRAADDVVVRRAFEPRVVDVDKHLVAGAGERAVEDAVDGAGRVDVEEGELARVAGVGDLLVEDVEAGAVVLHVSPRLGHLAHVVHAIGVADAQRELEVRGALNQLVRVGVADRTAQALPRHKQVAEAWPRAVLQGAAVHVQVERAVVAAGVPVPVGRAAQRAAPVRAVHLDAGVIEPPRPAQTRRPVASRTGVLHHQRAAVGLVAVAREGENQLPDAGVVAGVQRGVAVEALERVRGAGRHLHGAERAGDERRVVLAGQLDVLGAERLLDLGRVARELVPVARGEGVVAHVRRRLAVVGHRSTFAALASEYSSSSSLALPYMSPSLG
ncbi:MAG: hypothetical protein IPJ65_07240 [Archangiaceae bacterium]|nr:hypothetical protein [Archangiaceae bacterium]